MRDELIKHYGANTVRSGGLRVYTTINPRFQRAAEVSIRETLDQPGDPASAVVSINPANGAIRAMTAVTPGRKYEFNLVAQARRQAGSTFKTFVLATAVMKKIDPSSTSYVSAPYYYQPDPNVPAWEVSTYDHSYSGWTSIENATIRSDNTVFAQLTVDVGPENVAATARRMGVRTPLLAVPSLGLGSIAISPLDLASGYATLAGRGVYSRPMAIRKVILPGDREDTRPAGASRSRRRVMSEGEAYVVTKILEENMQYGTGTGAALVRPAAGKTGTTDDHADAWFAGYTPDLTTVVWVGYPQGEIPMEIVHGISVSGGSFPAEIWRLFMQRALWSSAPLDWVVPAELPAWAPWERGDDVLSYDPYAKPATGDGDDDGDDDRQSSRPAPPPPATAGDAGHYGGDATSEARAALRAWLLAAPVFLACSAVPTGGLGRERGYVDVDLYGTYAEGLLDGRLPYRDVFVEYPPGAFVVLVAAGARDRRPLPHRLQDPDGGRRARRPLVRGAPARRARRRPAAARARARLRRASARCCSAACGSTRTTRGRLR